MKTIKKIFRVALALACGLPAALQAQTIYVSNAGNNTIGEYQMSGAPVNPMLITELDSPYGIAISGNDLFVANNGNLVGGGIGEYGLNGAIITSVLIPTNFPTGIAISGTNLFMADQVFGTIGEYTTAGAVVNGELVSGLNGPGDIAVSGGDIFVTSFSAATVAEYTTSGATVHTALISHLSGPAGIAVSGGILYVVNDGNGTVGEYTTTGTTINSALISGLNEPYGIAVVGTNLLVVNYGSGTIGEYTTDGKPINATLISGLTEPRYIAIGPPAGSLNIGNIKINGNTLNLTAGNGPANGTYTLLESTNLLLPFNQWTPVLTNSFDGSGNVNLSTNIINPAVPFEFYTLEVTE